MDDLISRRAAIEALFDWEMTYDWDDHCREEDPKPAYIVSPSDVIEHLPLAQPDLDEWCTDCKEYDQERHSCPRWNRVIRETLKDAQPEPQWIPCSERLPEEDHWLGGSGRQFSDEVLVSIVNYDDEDTWTDISQTIDGEWALELPSHCKIIAWMPLPKPYGGEQE